MPNSSLVEQARRCADNIGCNNMMCAITINVWRDFENYIAQHSSHPIRFEDLDLAMLTSFVEMRSKRCVDVELLLLEITCIRMVLLESGFSQNRLTDLRVRIKRERLVNDENGKYRFAKVLCT